MQPTLFSGLNVDYLILARCILCTFFIFTKWQTFKINGPCDLILTELILILQTVKMLCVKFHQYWILFLEKLIKQTLDNTE